MFTSKFIDKNADWSKFQIKAQQVVESYEQTQNINKETAVIKRINRKAANESIPQTRQPCTRNSPAWFNLSIAKLIAERNKAFVTFRRCRNESTKVSYRKACA